MCWSIGAELPLPQNAQEDTDLYNYLNSINLVSGWLDGTDEAEEGVWLDSAGNNITFFNWRSDQPDNNNGREHYIMYRPGWDGLWNDHTGTHTDAVVCQKPAESVGELFSIVRRRFGYLSHLNFALRIL